MFHTTRNFLVMKTGQPHSFLTWMLIRWSKETNYTEKSTIKDGPIHGSCTKTRSLYWIRSKRHQCYRLSCDVFSWSPHFTPLDPSGLYSTFLIYYCRFIVLVVSVFGISCRCLSFPLILPIYCQLGPSQHRPSLMFSLASGMSFFTSMWPSPFSCFLVLPSLCFPLISTSECVFSPVVRHSTCWVHEDVRRGRLWGGRCETPERRDSKGRDARK